VRTIATLALKNQLRNLLSSIAGIACVAGPASMAGVVLASHSAMADPASPPHLLHEMFQDHAVLQRDRSIPVWGEAPAGDRVTLSMGAATLDTRADATGHWRAALPALPAGGPFTLTVRTQSGRSQSITDVLVGDVYLCSGQSNMELAMTRSLDAAGEIAAAKNDRIRLMSVARVSSAAPLAHFQNPVAWTSVSPDSVRDFSAVCYYFARELQKSVPVPLGLIHSSWGGSRIEPWMSDAALRGVGGFDARLDQLRLYARDPKTGNDRHGELWEQWWRDGAHSTPWKESGAAWRAAPEPMRDWKTWGVPELKNHDGMVWFQRSVMLTAQQAAATATLNLGAIDKVDETWVNGRPIGNSFGYATERSYGIPPATLRAGENSIVVNVLSTWGTGGMYGPADHMTLRFADGSTAALGGQWRYQPVPESMGLPPRAAWDPLGGLSSIHNAMIAPLLPYGLKGVLWYQGESNAVDAAKYQALLSALMHDWRREFGAALPFLIVELPNFGKPSILPAASDWANLREAQRRAVLGDAHAALAVTIDVGEADELHPPNKQAVGRRLARAARHLIYGETLSASGPVPRFAMRSGDRIEVHFDGIDGALVTYSATRAVGFELCGSTQNSCRFVDSSVQHDRVSLDASAVADATRVRFCWGDAPLCNLYDRSGLPAGPFEIDIQQ
jgi:sialate O-acetylesterase